MKEFDITPIENVLANQENITGLLNLLESTLDNSLKLIRKYNTTDISTIPPSTINVVAFQLLNDRESLRTLLHFLRDTTNKDEAKLEKAVNDFYENKGDIEVWK